jgi:hypothetical protein
MGDDLYSAYLTALKNDIPHDMSIIQGQAMLGDGQAFFSDKGATALNIPSARLGGGSYGEVLLRSSRHLSLPSFESRRKPCQPFASHLHVFR